MEQRFFKYEGAGNDFLLFDGRDREFDPQPQLIEALCHRRFGIGADGAMILGNDPQAEFSMRYYNSDGFPATMCGNGGRCIALFAEHLGIGGPVKTFRAIDGLHTAQLLRLDGPCGTVRLQLCDVQDVRLAENYALLDTGSPHYVEWVADTDKIDVVRRGRSIRNTPAITGPHGANVNFVQPLGPGRIRVRTYERGVENETYACGTGAAAAAIATASRGDHSMDFVVEVPGGTLRVQFDRSPEGGFRHVYLTGEARQVFSGTFETNNFMPGSIYFKKNI